MDEMNPSVESAVASSPAIETKVDNGRSSENVVDTRQAIDNAKKKMFGDKMVADQKPVVAEQKTEGTGEENDTEVQVTNIERKAPTDKAREHDKKQISKLVAQKHNLKEENARLMAEIEKFKEKMSHEPQPEDFEDVRAYDRAKIRYDMEKENGVERFQEAKSQLDEKRHTEWTERCQATVKNYDTFAEKYTKYNKWLAQNEPELMSYAGQSIIGPRMIEEAFNDLFSNAEVYSRWQGMNRHGKNKFLADIEHKIMAELNNGNQQKQVSPQKSKAPSPITPEKFSDKTVSRAVSMKDQIAKAKQRMFA